MSDDIKKPLVKATQKEIKNLINNQNFLGQDPDNGDPVTSCMDIYKAKIWYDGSLDNLRLIIFVKGDLQNKELVGDTWSPTDSMMTLKYFFADADKHKSRVHQLYFIRAFLQAIVKNRVFVTFDSRLLGNIRK